MSLLAHVFSNPSSPTRTLLQRRINTHMNSTDTIPRRRRLLRPGCPVLKHLGGHVKFEMAVGLNGRVWVSAPTTRLTLLVANAIQTSEMMNPKQTATFVAQLLRGA